MFNFLKFFVLLLIGLPISSFANDCPPDVCAKDKPTVDKNGKILLSIYYDNDDPNDPYQWSTNMVLKGCQAADTFPGSNFDVDFIVGAGSMRGNNNELISKHDIEADRREGCVAKLLNDASKFNKFACCNARGGSDKNCALEQGVSESELGTCVDNRESDELLMGNGDRRRDAGIPGCHVPEFAFNGVVDRCIKIPTFEDLRSALCEIFNRADVSVSLSEGQC